MKCNRVALGQLTKLPAQPATYPDPVLGCDLQEIHGTSVHRRKRAQQGPPETETRTAEISVDVSHESGAAALTFAALAFAFSLVAAAFAFAALAFAISFLVAALAFAALAFAVFLTFAALAFATLTFTIFLMMTVAGQVVAAAQLLS